MYTLHGTFGEVAAWLSGYGAARVGGDPLGSTFRSFVSWRLGFPDKVAWEASIRDASLNDSEARELLAELATSFADELASRNKAGGPIAFHHERAPPDVPDSPEEAVRHHFLRMFQDYPEGVADLLCDQTRTMRIGRMGRLSTELRVVLSCDHAQALVTVRRGDRWIVANDLADSGTGSSS